MKKCVFSGTFDPPTTGHKNVIEKCLQIFDQVVVAVMVNTGKTPMLTTEQREYLLKKLFKNQPRVTVKVYGCAAVDVLQAENTPFYVRGVRNTVDFEYENANFFANKQLKDDIVTIYIPAEQSELHVSSTLVRNSVVFNKQYANYVPAEIYDDFVAMASQNGGKG